MAQVYVGDLESAVPRPIHELKAFRKVILEPDESTQVEIELPLRDFAWFDVAVRRWRVEAGTFRVSVGFSIANLVLETDLTLQATLLDV